jgi:cytochrome c biogenesis protein CcmG, thiol:disulfide interchange protein DsbE
LKRKLLTGAVLGLIVGLLILFASPSYRQGEPSLQGKQARDFAFTVNGKSERLSNLRGKVVLLNFWASWCGPCVDEAPALNQLQTKIAAKGGTILGVSVDDDQAAYQDFLKTHSIDFPTYRDASKNIPVTYGTMMYPETYIINRDGRIERKIIGEQDWTSPTMVAYLDTLLDQK